MPPPPSGLRSFFTWPTPVLHLEVGLRVASSLTPMIALPHFGAATLPCCLSTSRRAGPGAGDQPARNCRLWLAAQRRRWHSFRGSHVGGQRRRNARHGADAGPALQLERFMASARVPLIVPTGSQGPHREVRRLPVPGLWSGISRHHKPIWRRRGVEPGQVKVVHKDFPLNPNAT